MTAQEIFDRVACHLLAQADKAQEYGICKYVDSSGLQCAIGCLIPPGHEAMASDSFVCELVESFPDLPFAGASIDLLRALQRVHDSSEVWSWSMNLAAVAARWRLDPAAAEA